MVKYHQPRHNSPFTPYELVWVDEVWGLAGPNATSQRWIGWVHKHIVDDPQKRGWNPDDYGVLHPPLLGIQESKLFDTREEAIANRE